MFRVWGGRVLAIWNRVVKEGLIKMMPSEQRFERGEEGRVVEIFVGRDYQAKGTADARALR